MDDRHEIKRKYFHKNKNNKKKPKYHNIKNLKSRHKVLRCYVKSKLNIIEKDSDNDKLFDFVCPFVSGKSTTWWDCRPYKHKVYD